MKTYQRDAKTPNVSSDVIVGLTGVWRVYSLRLKFTHTHTPQIYTIAVAQNSSVLYTVESIRQLIAEHLHVWA